MWKYYIKELVEPKKPETKKAIQKYQQKKHDD